MLRKTPDGQLYWRAANSFGENWGESGTFRIARNHDESSFELNIHAAVLSSSGPKTSKFLSNLFDNNRLFSYDKEAYNTTSTTR
jgi:aminopeptidase C